MKLGNMTLLKAKLKLHFHCLFKLHQTYYAWNEKGETFAIGCAQCDTIYWCKWDNEEIL